ncbi:MAG TPA: DUF5667 domain-containing protein, partial [Candidatus Paceibacterota bacterium]
VIRLNNKNMRVKIVLSVLGLFLFLGAAGAAFAQEDLPEAGLSAEGLPEAGLTPASPFHVFERFGDWMRLNVFTLNQARKAEVKVEIAAKRLSELKAVAEAGEPAEVIAKAGAFARDKAGDAEKDLERLDEAGRDVTLALDKFAELSLAQQAVLEKVLEKAPEESKEALTRALEASSRGLAKATEVAARQIEKGHLDKEHALAFAEKTLLKMTEQLAERSARLEELGAGLGEVPPETRALFEEKLKLLEESVFTFEARDEFKDLREEIRGKIKEAAKTASDARRQHELDDEEIEEALDDIAEDKFRPQEKAREMIAKAEKEIAEAEAKISEAEAEGTDIRENVRELMDNAREHLREAKAAFDEEQYGRAFGPAVAASHNAEAAIRKLEKKVIESRQELKEKENAIKRELEEKPEVEKEKTDLRSRIKNIVPLPFVAPAMTVPRTRKVEVGEAGFNPKELKIKKGDTVIWTNASSRQVWPASAVHPTHQELPGFDSLRGISADESYSFRFDKPGSWRYHDHLNPALTGVVQVSE